MSEKPVGIILPTWDPNEPRFRVAEATEHISDDRVFKNGKCVENQRLKIVYSVDDIVDVLNRYEDLEKESKDKDKEIKILHERIRILREEIQSTVYVLRMQTRKLEGY